MNIETGQIYTSVEQVADAMERGEELMRLTPDQQRLLGIGRARRKQVARRAAKAKRALTTAMVASVASQPALSAGRQGSK